MGKLFKTRSQEMNLHPTRRGSHRRSSQNSRKQVGKDRTQLPRRTNNEIKNLWNSSLEKKLTKQGIDLTLHQPFKDHSSQFSQSLPLPKPSRTTSTCTCKSRHYVPFIFKIFSFITSIR